MDKTIKTLRFYCQKVLPLVYDDSLSYYELLSKVCKKLNEVITAQNGIPDYIEKKIKEYIANQLNEDKIAEQLTLEDIDPFTGSK